jgi:hypothetical protein
MTPTWVKGWAEQAALGITGEHIKLAYARSREKMKNFVLARPQGLKKIATSIMIEQKSRRQNAY